MAQHVRYTDGVKNERAVVKFQRPDLLWRGRVGDVDVPFAQSRRMVGPTILDLLVRVDEDGRAYWTLRPAMDFFEGRGAGGPNQFKSGLVSGGKLIRTEGDFMRVQKISSVSVGAYAYRLAVGTLGSIGDAHAAIASKAAAAWTADLSRSLALYQAVLAAPSRRLVESAAIAALRPAGSISDQVETEILREACLLLGVDPDLNIKRAPGRPRKDGAGHTEAGDFIAVTIVDGVVSAKTIAAIGGVASNTDLSSLTVLKLAALLDTLVQGGAQVDTDLLEAYLDAAAPDWRETASDTSTGDRADEDPYTILGVTRGTSLEDITKAYRRAMQAMHPDKGACPPWFAQMAAQAYRRIKAEQESNA